MRRFLMNEFRLAKYRFEHWMFKWTKDQDNDITFTVMGFINFTKYKEHTIIKFARHYERAPKYVVLTY